MYKDNIEGGHTFNQDSRGLLNSVKVGKLDIKTIQLQSFLTGQLLIDGDSPQFIYRHCIDTCIESLLILTQWDGDANIAYYWHMLTMNIVKLRQSAIQTLHGLRINDSQSYQISNYFFLTWVQLNKDMTCLHLYHCVECH